ncbi:hypothetical protein [Kocuria carniphila]|uniref:Uncharacterized protein n=1 Tax=Kocuria carniphila TaxID=262208 RepID=A0ABV3V5U2_9MICC
MPGVLAMGVDVVFFVHRRVHVPTRHCLAVGGRIGVVTVALVVVSVAGVWARRRGRVAVGVLMLRVAHAVLPAGVGG